MHPWTLPLITTCAKSNYLPCKYQLRHCKDILKQYSKCTMCTECSKCSKCSIKVRLPYRILFYLKSPIFILQRAYIPKNGVEFRQQTNSDNRTGVATSRDVADLPSLGVTGLIVYFSDFHTLRGEVWKIHCQTCHT